MGCPHGDEPQRCAICLRAQLQQAQERAEAAEDAARDAYERLAEKTTALDEQRTRAEAAEALMASVAGLCTVLMARWPNLRTTLHAEAIVGAYFAPAEALAQRGEAGKCQ